MKRARFISTLLIAAAIAGCAAPKGEHRVVLDPAAGRCYCTIQYDVKQTVGNLVMGDMRLVVRNDGAQACQVALPKQDAQALLEQEAQGFSVDEQPAKTVSPGQSVTFSMPFAMTPSYLRAERLFALRVDDRIAVVGPASHDGTSRK
jgi:hypothetical protein